MTRAEAIAAGAKFYDGLRCEKHGTTVRYISGGCVECTREKGRQRRRTSEDRKPPTRSRRVWHLYAIPPGGGQPEPLISPITDRPVAIEFGRAFAEQLARENSARLAHTGFRFVARAA